jgi:MtN3 and saliva related transmembrane protein
MEMTTALGLVAGGLTTASLVPQVLKIRRSKSAEDISLGMFVAFCAGVTLWIVFGSLKGELAIIITNGVTLVFGLLILLMKLKYK